MVSHIIIKDQAIRAQPGGLPFFYFPREVLRYKRGIHTGFAAF